MRQKAKGWEHYGAVALSIQLLEAMLQPLTTGSMHLVTRGSTAKQLKFLTDGSQNVVAKGNPMNSPGKCSLGG